MASMSSRSTVRIRDEDRAARGGVGRGGDGRRRRRDVTEELIHSSRTPRRSNRFEPDPQPMIFNFNGDVQITKGTMFGRSPGEEMEHLQRARPTLPARSNACGEAAQQRPKPHRIIATEDEEAEEGFEGLEPEGDYTWGDEPPQQPLASSSRATPTSAQQVQTWKDSAYGGSPRGPNRDKNEVYRASLSRESPNGSLAEEGSSHTDRKTKLPSLEQNVEEGITSEDDETQLAAQGDDAGDNNDNSDDSDDEFERRLMKVATADYHKIDVDVILDTGTKPDWISSRFLTETLGLKYARLNEEENKREYKDFSGNKFNGVGKAEVLVISTDFIDFPCRKISFLVAKGGHFQILLGSRTIKKENLFCKPADPQREGVFPAVQTGPKKEERAVIVQNKEKQKKEGAERDKMRVEIRKSKMKEKKESKSSSSSAVRLAQESQPRWREKSPSPSPLRNAKHLERKNPKPSWKKTKTPVDERSSSSSSLSGGGAAIDD